MRSGEERHRKSLHLSSLNCATALNVLMATYKVDGSKAAMADLTQVCEEFLRILLVKKFRHLRVLETPSPRTRRHGQRLHTHKQKGVCTLTSEATTSDWKNLEKLNGTNQL